MHSLVIVAFMVIVIVMHTEMHYSQSLHHRVCTADFTVLYRRKP